MPTLAPWNLDVREDAAIERHDESQSRIVDVEPAHERAVCTLEDADDPAFGAIAALMFEAGDDAIAVERLLDVGRRDVQVLPRLVVVGDDEAVAGGMHLEAAHNHVHAVGEPEAIPADL